MRCGACREELNFYEVQDFFGEIINRYWVHYSPKDHVPVPVLTGTKDD
jgi:hypothetical protein